MLLVNINTVKSIDYDQTPQPSSRKHPRYSGRK